ncbi:MAG: T9SS type A sorting domain-containing protein [Ignavibacterium sp.]
MNNAQPIIIQANVDKKIASNGVAYNYFGSAVAIDSTTIMIGAVGFDNYKGAVYVFTKTDSGWFQTQFLTDPNAVPGEFFGNAISINENTAAIAGYGRSVVLIYQKIGGNWVYRSTISVEEPHLWFGISVKVNHYNSILVGTHPDVWTQAKGRAYLYTFNTNWQIAKIFYSPDSHKTFGNSVDFIPDTIPAYLIGDFSISYNGISGYGAVYLYVWNGSTWSESVIRPSSLTSGSYFGWDIESPNNSTIIISAYYQGINSHPGAGAVYVYKFNPSSGWQNNQRITAPDLTDNMLFGNSISAQGDILLIGANYSDNYKGSAYLYKWIDTAYVFLRKINAEDGEQNDEFGVSFGVYKNNYVIGAHNDNVNGNDYRGSAYVYSPVKVGQAHNIDLYASTIHSGTVIIDTSTISDPGALPPNMILHSNKSWIVNSQNGFDFMDGIVGADLDSLSKKSNSSNHLCWLKRKDENSPWEYIGGRVTDNYLYSTIPFDSLSQFVIVDSGDTATNVENENLLVNDFELYQNYPNPFNPSTTISWQSPVGGWQTIKLFDVLGREIETIVDGYYEAGFHSTLYIVNSTLPSGVYFYQLKLVDTETSSGQTFIQTKKMMLIK